MSARSRGATSAPRLGRRNTSPSAARRISASRTGVREIPNLRTRLISSSLAPGFRPRWRISLRSATWTLEAPRPFGGRADVAARFAGRLRLPDATVALSPRRRKRFDRLYPLPTLTRKTGFSQCFSRLSAPSAGSGHKLLIELGAEPTQLLARELLAKLPGRQAEMSTEAPGEHLGTGEAAGRGDILDRNVAVEEGVASR